ncbi:MAG: hypothetical protein IPK21_18700 [Haliscomenobacter sp.]|nr:hypothetical protein [Haliscomenobacter sp.]
MPGSSIRGMIRNVLEIMTFSKMGGKWMIISMRSGICQKGKEIYRDFSV